MRRLCHLVKEVLGLAEMQEEIKDMGTGWKEAWILNLVLGIVWLYKLFNFFEPLSILLLILLILMN